jgi:hypothetical protein
MFRFIIDLNDIISLSLFPIAILLNAVILLSFFNNYVELLVCQVACQLSIVMDGLTLCRVIKSCLKLGLPVSTMIEIRSETY